MLKLFLLVCVAVASTSASAHAFLDHAVPAVGSTVRQSPKEIRLWFTERLEPAFSKARVVDKTGKQVDAGDSHVDAADPTVITTTVRALAPGSYRVVWRVVSVDTHVTEGDFTFEVS